MTLAEWLKKEEFPMERFSRKAGVGISTIHRLVKGGRAKIDTARAVHRATNGEVSLESLISGGELP